MIIDTDVLIWFLRGNEKAITAVTEAIPFSISIVTYMELVKGMRNKRELEKMKKAFKKMEVRILPINEDDSMHAAEYVEKFFLSNNIEMADALIAATSVDHNEVLYTANDKHYKFVDGLSLKVFRP